MGNTVQPIKSSITAPVHPHARGEHAAPRLRQGTTDGSSPRAWGTRAANCCHARERRFIPTRVGNTWWCSLMRSATAVHPHARGEHSVRENRTVLDPGSSPRAWGTHVDPMCVLYALTVHPHARGEHFAFAYSRSCSYGSSPRAWGTRRQYILARLWRRFIPTRVGNTPPRVPNPRPEPVHPHARGEHAQRAA